MTRNRLLLTGALLLALSTPIHAQDLEGFAGLRFRFEAPGARSAGMGGTSQALTDTFSAASNPASLAHIRERRIALDARRTTFETEFITAGTIGSFATTSAQSKSSGLAGAIVVLPARNATWALYVDEPLNAAMSTNDLPHGVSGSIVIGERNGQYLPATSCPGYGEVVPISEACNFIVFNSPAAFRADTRASLQRIGGAVAFARGPLAFGASAQYAHLEEHARSFDFVSRANDSQVTWSAGVQWQLSPSLHLGASYHSGAKFAVSRTSDSALPSYYEIRSFNTPSSYGGGLAFDVAPNFTLALDAVRVRYSEVLKPIPALEANPVFAYPYAMPDVTELRAGAEYRLPTRIPVALRGGWWRDPAHRLRSVTGESWMDVVNLVLLDEDENHVTYGIGVGDRVRVDAAVDRSEHTTRGSLTLATKF